MASLLLTPRPNDTLTGRTDRARLGEPPLSEVVKTTANDLVTLATAEIKLARLEIVAGLRHAADRAGWVAAGATALLVGYLVGVAALSAWLSTFWGWPGALATTALSQAILGGAVLWAAPGSTGPQSSSHSASPPTSRGSHG